MKLDALDHPKTLDLAARLGIELPTVIGHLELLWAFTGKKSPRGDVGKWPVGAIARACYWMGDPQAFMAALVDAGFVDEHPVDKYVIHDWADHAPRWVKAKLKNLGQDFISNTASTTGTTTGELAVQTTGLPTKGSEDKTSEGKGRSATTGAVAPPVADLDLGAFTRWSEYLAQVGKPLAEASNLAAAEELAKFGADQAAVVQQSIARGWKNLFELKKGNGNGHAANGSGEKPKRSPPTPEEIAAARAQAIAANAATIGKVIGGR